MPRALHRGRRDDATAEGAPLGHTGVALGGETGGSHENRYCFRRPLVIDGCFWRDCSAGASRRDPSLPRGFGESVTTDRSPAGGMGPTRAQLSSPGAGELAVTDPSPRAAVVASLASTLSRAVDLGDEVAARVVHEALGRLLGLPVAPER